MKARIRRPFARRGCSRGRSGCTRPRAARRGPAAESRDDLIFIALGHSMRELDLPLTLFDDLLSAFAQDITTTRYDSWPHLFDYCRRSANPVGRLVLRIAGYRDEALDRSSDALCTALQLTNFWQDFGRDWRAGRLYVPRETCRVGRRVARRSRAPRASRRLGRRALAVGRPDARLLRAGPRWSATGCAAGCGSNSA